MSKLSRQQLKEIERATKNRREIVAAQFSRRDMMKMGLITSAGFVVPSRGLSARWRNPRAGFPDDSPVSPPTTPFVEPLPIMPIAQPVASLTPAPTVQPNAAAGEGRTRPHQGLTMFPPKKLYERHFQPVQVSIHRELPVQTMWGINGTTPGPTFINRYDEPILVRNFNELPPPNQNGGFGLPSISSHLHNGHTPSESDGFACDFFERGQWYDQHFPNIYAGFASDHRPVGDMNESLSTLWYHDHRVDFTSQNVYKGLAGMFLLFNDQDTGDETAGYRLPSSECDVPLMLADKVLDPTTGLVFFDLFNLDGILGDKFLVNGKIQPFFQVHPRRYRFRIVNTGPSRWYELHLTDLNNLSAAFPFWQVCNDGNLFPKPLRREGLRLGVAERSDIIIDFSQFKPATSIYLENRLEQFDGRGPTGNVLPASQGNLLLRFDVVLPPVPDYSADPATVTSYYDLPDKTAQPRVTRTFAFERQNGMWAINGTAMDCDVVRFTVEQNSVEHWVLVNNSGGWMHPIHIHLEEGQILSRNGSPPAAWEVCRKDLYQLQHGEAIEIFYRFRDWTGRYPMHCHNTVHEDHAMILRWEIQSVGDTNPQP